MNKERVLDLADFLLTTEVSTRFDMDYFLRIPQGLTFLLVEGPTINKVMSFCGTTACLAGWAAYRAQPNAVILPLTKNYTIKSIAKEYLDLDDHQAQVLFTPDESDWNLPSSVDPYSATARQASQVLRHLADTGDVDWRILE